MNFRISPSQATEALLMAKGSLDDVQAAHEPFDDDEFRRFANWFTEKEPMLKRMKGNYMF